MYAELTNMRDRLLPELVANRNRLSEAERKENDARLAWITEEILELSRIARDEGLLALEEAATRYANRDTFRTSMYKTLMLIVDGTDADRVKKIMIVQYLSSCLDGYDAAEYLLMLYGMLMIQAGEEIEHMRKALNCFLNLSGGTNET